MFKSLKSNQGILKKFKDLKFLKIVNLSFAQKTKIIPMVGKTEMYRKG